ncbi:MAG: cold shock domain-containing protein [Ardenticatenales bacterium]
MALRDQPMRCGACGYRFVYTVREQRQRAELGLWESSTLLFCPRCKSADVQAVDTGNVNTDEPRREPSAQPPAADGNVRRDGDRAGAGDAAARQGGRSDDRHAPRRDGGGDRPPRRGDGPPRGGHGRPGGGRRPERRVARQTELRVRYVGTVKWFDPTRGYGFIAEDDGGELFLHASGILIPDAAMLHEGTPVEYEIERTGRGPQAVDVVPLA